MFTKINEYLEKQKKAIEQREQLRKAQAYYRLIKAGAAFIKFVQEDMKRQENSMNRHERRRMEAELSKGVISPELVNYYQQKIDYVLGNIHQRLNPPKPQKNPNVQVQNTPPEVKK